MHKIMMKELSDEQLLAELKSRIEQKKQSFVKLEEMNEELSKANQKLVESEQLKSNFLSNARNEIINPLSSILSISQSIAFSENTDLAQIQKLASIIYTEAFDLDFQMNNIFASAEIEAGEASCEYYNIDFVDLVEKQIDKFKNFALDKGLQLVLENGINDNAHNLKSDPSKIEMIVSNLIVNAINWTDEPGDIIIRILNDGAKKVISVSDHGRGISKEDQNIIFDRFKSIDPTVYTKNKGHGLGLSIVKAFAEILDGEIKLESASGKGSTFSLIIADAPSGDEIMGSSEGGQDFLFDDSTELF